MRKFNPHLALLALLFAGTAAIVIPHLKSEQAASEALLIRNIDRAFEKGLLLPRDYVFPGGAFSISLVCLLPDLAHEWLDASPQDLSLAFSHLRNIVKQKWFLWRLRLIFLIIMLAPIGIVFSAVKALKKSDTEALMASAFTAAGIAFVSLQGSFFEASAGSLFFSSLSVLFLLKAQDKKQRVSLWLSASAAGFAWSHSYAAFWLIAFLGWACFSLRKKQARERIQGP